MFFRFAKTVIELLGTLFVVGQGSPDYDMWRSEVIRRPLYSATPSQETRLDKGTLGFLAFFLIISACF